jgi:hypothetical protein
MMRALRITTTGTMEVVTLADADTADEPQFVGMQRLIGCDVMTTAFTIGVEDGRELVGYVDDEGLLKPHPAFSCMPDLNLRIDAQPMAGAILITAMNEAGETAEITDAEIERFSLVRTRVSDAWSTQMVGTPIPILRYKES